MAKQTDIHHDAAPLAAAIEKRYPGVHVVAAFYSALPDGTITGQHLCLRATKTQLTTWGLVAASDFPRSETVCRGNGYLGVNWGLRKCVEQKSRPLWDFSTYTQA